MACVADRAQRGGAIEVMKATPTIPRPANETQRLRALRRYGILDSPADADFDFLTEMAALVCGAPFAFVTLVDGDRVWVKSASGTRSGGERPRDEDYCSWTILEHEDLHLPDLLRDARTQGMALTREKGWRMYSGVNLHVGDGRHIGTLCVLDTRPHELSPAQRRLLQRLGRQVMALIELRAAQRELQAKVDELDLLSRHDALTGLANRRELLATLERELAHARRYGGALSLALLDVDHFKAVNDEFGHPTGDEVLRRLGQVLAGAFRRVDTVGRWGGEEFMVVLPRTPLHGAQVSLEGMREQVSGLAFEGLPRALTVSCGLAALGPGLESAAALIAAADAALYRAKRQGRNRVVVADEPVAMAP